MAHQHPSSDAGIARFVVQRTESEPAPSLTPSPPAAAVTARPTLRAVPPADAAPVNVADTQDLYSFIESRGYHFPRELISRYLIALRTKPFALFTGISGTGKTKLALLVAEYYARTPGTTATRWERPEDSDHEFFVPIDQVTLRAGTLTPTREQLDYFNVPSGASVTFTGTITNILGAQGDMTFHASNLVVGGQRHITVQVPSTVRRAFADNGVCERDYLRFEIVEEFKRYRVSLFRPQSEQVEIPARDRYAFVSVRPSWDDHTAMIGAWDPHLEQYVRTPILELLLRARREERDAAAAGHAPAPYFIMLDEMNIARIEHYFSDFLSALESRRLDEHGAITQEPLHLHSADARHITWIDELGVEYDIPQRFAIPTNVVFTGTLNLDDSTWGLSPKVIDRASTLNFSGVDYQSFLTNDVSTRDCDPLELPESAAAQPTFLGTLQLAGSDHSRAVAAHLEPFVRLNELLVEHDQHYGYRVLNDVGLYVATVREFIGDDPATLHAAVDACVLQKVLPKFYGWRRDRGGLLAGMLSLAIDGEVPRNTRGIDAAALLRDLSIDADDRAHRLDAATASVYLPRTAGRLARMIRVLD